MSNEIWFKKIKELFLNKEISYEEFNVLCGLAVFADKNGLVGLGVNFLKSEFGLSRGTFLKRINRLKSKELIIAIVKPRTATQYRLNLK